MLRAVTATPHRPDLDSGDSPRKFGPAPDPVQSQKLLFQVSWSGSPTSESLRPALGGGLAPKVAAHLWSSDRCTQPIAFACCVSPRSLSDRTHHVQASFQQKRQIQPCPADRRLRSVDRGLEMLRSVGNTGANEIITVFASAAFRGVCRARSSTGSVPR
jgi:hypothetical protein